MKWKSFGATNEPHTCLWCGKRLSFEYAATYVYYRWAPKVSRCCKAPVKQFGTFGVEGPKSYELPPGTAECSECEGVAHTIKRRSIKRTRYYELPGPYGNGFFCSQGCGCQFGISAAKNNFRLQRKGASS